MSQHKVHLIYTYNRSLQHMIMMSTSRFVLIVLNTVGLLTLTSTIVNTFHPELHRTYIRFDGPAKDRCCGYTLKLESL